MKLKKKQLEEVMSSGSLIIICDGDGCPVVIAL